jgi:hypothetical protein
MHRTILLIITILLLLVSLSACADEGSASKVVEDYLKAKVASDADKLVSLACAEWEAQATQDALSFKSVDAELQNMSCESGDKDGQYTLVTCKGEIVAEYDGEQRSQNLSETTYRAIKENDEWKMCGEQ